MTIFRKASLIAALIGLAGCVQTGGAANGFSPAVADLAEQRMRFITEAVCLSHKTPAAQRRAARGLNFLVPAQSGGIADPGATGFVSPATATSLRIGPVEPQSFENADGEPQIVRGSGCSVGSPAVSIDRANRIMAEILAPRLVEGDRQAGVPIGSGTNDSGGAGFFFENLAVTLPLALTPFTEEGTGRRLAHEHPIILIVHY